MPMPYPPPGSSAPPLRYAAAAVSFGRGAEMQHPGLGGVDDAHGGAHVEGALVHLPAVGVSVPERHHIRPGLQPVQLARLARAPHRHRHTDGPDTTRKIVY
jgi:hypothetical protein